jgi:hypothetical protein
MRGRRSSPAQATPHPPRSGWPDVSVIAGERVETTPLSPEDEFVYRPMAVDQPLAPRQAQRHPLDAIARHVGAGLIRGSPCARRAPRSRGGLHHPHRACHPLREDPDDVGIEVTMTVPWTTKPVTLGGRRGATVFSRRVGARPAAAAAAPSAAPRRSGRSDRDLRRAQVQARRPTRQPVRRPVSPSRA